jgi:hypothetical protein
MTKRVSGLLVSCAKLLIANDKLNTSQKSLPFQKAISTMSANHMLGQFNEKDPYEMTDKEVHRTMAGLDEILCWFTKKVEEIQDDITPEEYQITVTLGEDWELCDIPSD